MPYESMKGGAAPAQGAPMSTGGGGRYGSMKGGGAPDIQPAPQVAVEPVRRITDGGGRGKTLAAGAAGLGLLGGGLALAAKGGGRLGSAAKGLLALRSQLMLSGLAPLKSGLGNVGAGVAASIERGTAAPIKAVLSRQTLQDAVAAFKRGTPAAQEVNQVTLKNPLTGKELWTPGRLMGALDEATQLALQRGGLEKTDAAREVLQTPLGVNYGPAGKALDNPVASYLIPFRRTPLNQLWEGFRTYGRALEGEKGVQRALGVYSGAGAVHGAATADDSTPVSIPLAVAASGRYGVPYAVAALIARGLAGAKNGGGIASNITPVSEYGIEQGLMDPGKPFGLSAEDGFTPEDLAPIKALERLGLR